MLQRPRQCYCTLLKEKSFLSNIDDIPVDFINSFNFLSVILDDNLKWNHHINTSQENIKNYWNNEEN